jgi:hypothetical protein
MSLAVVMAFEILAALALGFVIGRIWQIRRDELDRRNFKVPPVARIPRLQSPLTISQNLSRLAECSAALSGVRRCSPAPAGIALPAQARL